MADIHHRFMRQALVLARKGVGKTSPNPAVGCVIVRDGQVVGKGWHRRAGTPHAEVHALQDAGELARGGDVYVTLEPCSHFGKTPPCADALVRAGVARVFVGMVDPNPKVSGRGIEKVKAAGIEVAVGILEEQCRAVNNPFIKHITTGLPYVTLKSAMTLDGKTATATGDSRWVTGDASRRLVHRMRAVSDAIMVGIGTVLADDPLLTCRIRKGCDPVRVIVDSKLSIPLLAQVFTVASSARTVIATITADPAKVRAIEALGAEVLICRAIGERVDLRDLMARLGESGIQSVLLEGGAGLAGEMLAAGLIDRCLFFYAPKLVGGDGVGLFAANGVERMGDAVKIGNVAVRRCGDDIIVEGEPIYRCLPD
ncbi:bifunctional diaminohydroxyphosphoribosylaminopyrimidine deaminase/5-amino-6-(5-phosphoribosylamino)uracil reductase RibD [Geobacter sp. OR-1]|uniref:bifunctional diaminohydroxyphosphoribosylaminopyrimidine deaminase/5-amino-6-(5-phosphoribosylamino)uracil reductase RibD n=1 Tax=Geobacter sp. OR-1 TaxID=1266765 RepID=UPI00351C0317